MPEEHGTSSRVHALLFAMPRMAGTFSHTGLFILSLPLLLLSGESSTNKGMELALVNSVAAICSMGLLWFFGSTADRRTHEYGNRWLVILSLALAVPPLIVLTFFKGIALAAVALVAMYLARILTDSLLLAHLAEDDTLVPKERFTTALVFMHFLGSLTGAVAFGLLPFSFAAASGWFLLPVAGLATVLTVTALLSFVLATKEDPVSQKRITPYSPFSLNSDCKRFLAGRCFFLAGILVVPLFLVYMIDDVVQVADVKGTSAELMICLLVGGLLASAVSSRLMRKRGELILLFKVGFLLAVVAPLFMLLLWRGSPLIYGCMVLLGAGFGVIMAAGTALNVRLVGKTGMAGRYMALVTISTFFAQFLASSIGGVVLDLFNRIGANLGYIGLLVLVECFFCCGWLVMRGITIAEHP